MRLNTPRTCERDLAEFVRWSELHSLGPEFESQWNEF
jgi:hypothetical protein